MTTGEMMKEANFTSATPANILDNPAWDFPNTWLMYEGISYPLLSDFMTPLTVTANSDVKTYDGLSYSGGNGVTYSALVNGIAPAGTLSYSGTSQGAINASSYVITPGGLQPDQHYLITFIDGALTVTAKTVTLSASKTYDGTTSLTDAVMVGTGIDGEALTYTGATASDAHVATAGKYIDAITLTDNVAVLASNYALPTFDVANAPVTISAATLTPTLTNDPVTKTYDGNTNAPTGFSPTYSFAGLVSGDTAATLANTGAAYNDKDVLDADTVTVSGLAISNITGSNSSAITDYALDAASKDVTATITARTVTLSASKTYDGTTSLTDAVMVGTGIDGEALTYTGATASDAHVATAGKYIDAITLTDNVAVLASNYALPTFDVANAPVTISAATLTPTLTNDPVTKTYDGNTNAPTGFSPTYSFAGLVSGDSGHTRQHGRRLQRQGRFRRRHGHGQRPRDQQHHRQQQQRDHRLCARCRQQGCHGHDHRQDRHDLGSDGERQGL